MDIDQNKQYFREEAIELLAELESALLELEEAPTDKNIVGRIFRAMHTIKGSGSMFGFDDIASFTHQVENIYDQVRNGKLQVSKELIDLTLAARDQIRAMLDSEGADISADLLLKSGQIISYMKALQNPPPGLVSAAATSSAAAGRQAPMITYRIRYLPDENIIKSGIDPLDIINDLKELGDHEIVVHTTNIPSENSEGTDYAFWDIILSTDRGIAAIRDILVRDIFVFVEKIDVLGEAGSPEEPEAKKLGEILVEKGDVAADALDKVLSSQRRVGELLVESGLATDSQVQAALAEQKHLKAMREKRETGEAGASIRVASDKLDRLVNLVGELVTVQARLSQTAEGAHDERFLLIAEEVERLTEELRDNTMGIRMLQIGSTFSKFKRLVRDLSKELGKEIELTTEGAETELDKTIIEKLDEPLIHLIRNSIDHGIESPDDRIFAGKPQMGTIQLSALHSGANVLIRISDDGKGLDPEVLRAKAIEKGLISQDAELVENELFSLIFASGFSTAKTVSNVSGRGVGMDVVKKSIDALRGEVEIASKLDEGTTVTLKLPLTLAIIDGFLVRVNQEHFVIPLQLVGECMEFTPEDRQKVQAGNIINVRDGAVPFVRLRELFNIQGKRPEIEHIVIVEVDGARVGFLADQIIGEHKTVIKSLGSYYKNIDGISGGTILGDGSVSLILDINKIVQRMKQQQVMAKEHGVQ